MSGTSMYILVARVAVPEPDPVRWNEWFSKSSREKTRHVALESVGPLTVSTVFLGLDHAWGGGPPIVFETMIFETEGEGNFLDSYQTRCSTWDEAERMHATGMAYARKLVDAAEAIKIGKQVDTGSTQ